MTAAASVPVVPHTEAPPVFETRTGRREPPQSSGDTAAMRRLLPEVGGDPEADAEAPLQTRLVRRESTSAPIATPIPIA